MEEYQIDYNDGTLTLKLEGQNQLVDYQLASITQFNQDIQPYIDQYEQTNDTTFKRNYLPAQETSLLVSLLPTLLLLGGMALLWVFMMRQAGGGSGKMNTFGKAKPKPLDDGRRVTFADVAGADEEKEELVEVVEFLKDPKKFNSLGARIPKGVLLMGPSGTGKTLLARAVAGEAGVPFYSISGSDFVEMFVGVGASRVRDLFDQAKKSAEHRLYRRDRRGGPPERRRTWRRTRRAGADFKPAAGGNGRLWRQHRRHRHRRQQPPRHPRPRAAAPGTL